MDLLHLVLPLCPLVVSILTSLMVLKETPKSKETELYLPVRINEPADISQLSGPNQIPKHE